jgi:hypothetical protein
MSLPLAREGAIRQVCEGGRKEEYSFERSARGWPVSRVCAAWRKDNEKMKTFVWFGTSSGGDGVLCDLITASRHVEL